MVRIRQTAEHCLGPRCTTLPMREAPRAGTRWLIPAMNRTTKARAARPRELLLCDRSRDEGLAPLLIASYPTLWSALLDFARDTWTRQRLADVFNRRCVAWHSGEMSGLDLLLVVALRVDLTRLHTGNLDLSTWGSCLDNEAHGPVLVSLSSRVSPHESLADHHKIACLDSHDGDDTVTGHHITESRDHLLLARMALPYL
jgi:hypothetical protein